MPAHHEGVDAFQRAFPRAWSLAAALARNFRARLRRTIARPHGLVY
jgi:hypothetical protein